jgi:hypothetical protein
MIDLYGRPEPGLSKRTVTALTVRLRTVPAALERFPTI